MAENKSLSAPTITVILILFTQFRIIQEKQNTTLTHISWCECWRQTASHGAIDFRFHFCLTIRRKNSVHILAMNRTMILYVFASIFV